MWTGKQWHSYSTFDQISPNIHVCYMWAINQKTLQVWCGRKKTTTKDTNKIRAYQKWIMADEFTFQWQKSNDSLNFCFQWYSISDSIVCWIVWTLLRQSAFKRWAHLGLCAPVLADAGGTCRGQLAHWPVWALPLIQITENHACESSRWVSGHGHLQVFCSLNTRKEICVKFMCSRSEGMRLT